MRVTVAKLKRLKACDNQVRLFAELFPDGVDVTEALCVAHAGKFNRDWAARYLLPAPLRADYESKRVALVADYESKRDALLADYEAKRAPLWADYESKRAPLWADYESKCAALFGRLAEQVK